MAIKIKLNEVEKLTETNIKRVIKELNQEKPITKKVACSILGIAYNTTRLNNIIKDFQENLEREKARRKAKRGTPVTTDELSLIFSESLEGKDLKSISKTIARPVLRVKKLLEEYEVPKRGVGEYLKPELIPDAAVRTSFRVGERVWSARYETLAIIEKQVPHKEENAYRVWLEGEKWQQYAYQPASELASLSHLTELGITI